MSEHDHGWCSNFTSECREATKPRGRETETNKAKPEQLKRPDEAMDCHVTGLPMGFYFSHGNQKDPRRSAGTPDLAGRQTGKARQSGRVTGTDLEAIKYRMWQCKHGAVIEGCGT